MNYTLNLAAAVTLAVLSSQSVHAQNAGSAGQAAEPIYGSQMMTEQERNAYRTQIQQAKTQQERAEIQARHHEEMVKRAAEQGKTLPEDVPANRGAMGQGQGQGMGQGQGQGMGQGKGQGQGGAGKGGGGKSR
jgi:hypothetical protein